LETFPTAEIRYPFSLRLLQEKQSDFLSPENITL